MKHIVYYHVFEDAEAVKWPLEIPNWFPKEEWERNTRYLRFTDRRNNLIGKLLLKVGLHEIGYSADIIKLMAYSGQKRPSLDIPWDFNITHCDDLVAVVLGENVHLGLDVENIHPLDIEDFRSCFTMREWELIQNAEERELSFFRYWTRKEAILKAIGSGLQIHPSGFEAIHEQVMFESHSWNLHEIHLDAVHVCTLATDDPNPEIILHEVMDPYKLI